MARRAAERGWSIRSVAEDDRGRPTAVEGGLNRDHRSGDLPQLLDHIPDLALCQLELAALKGVLRPFQRLQPHLVGVAQIAGGKLSSAALLVDDIGLGLHASHPLTRHPPCAKGGLRPLDNFHNR